MKTVKQVIRELLEYPMNACVRAYEGEGTGLAIDSAKKSREGFRDQIGWIDIPYEGET